MLTGWKAFAENTGYRVADKYIKKTGGKGKMVKKIENRNIDVTKARGELEEDLLEYVYRTWRQGRQITSKEYAREVNITGYEAAGLVRSLVKKGFLCEPENGHLELSDKGKLEGMECLARHEKLTQFFQMVSGMDQQRAQEDACRVEHYISPEGLKGIENFLQYGDVYDRVYDDMDLYTFYEDGEFPMAFGLYEPERRNPRFLAPEYGKLEHSVILRVKKSQNCFLLKTKKDESIGYVWYRRDDEWIQAKEDACRVEHYISPEGLKGIENFLQYGDVYDRVYDDMDLYTFYEDGEFPMAFGLYEPERRNPRFLAPEYGKLEHSVILRVKKSQNCFLLKTKKDESIGYVWYRRDDEWIQAKEEKGVYQLPTDICTYTANTGIPITEAVAIIAITRFEQKPLPIDYRELNIHVW